MWSNPDQMYSATLARQAELRVDVEQVRLVKRLQPAAPVVLVGLGLRQLRAWVTGGLAQRLNGEPRR